MTQHELDNEWDMLKADICRMCITDNEKELYQYYKHAEKHIERIYNGNLERLRGVGD